MHTSTLTLLRCPACSGRLVLGGRDAGAQSVDDDTEIESGTLVCSSCEQSFRVSAGTPHLVHPPDLLPSDAEFQEKYDTGAEQYDIGLDWLFSSFGEDQEEFRRRLVGLLELKPGARVLETGCGTGQDSIHIAEQIGPEGHLYAQDLSIGMLRLAAEKLRAAPSPADTILSNAAYLPFGDGVFDAAFHFGGINTFGEMRRAIDELTRVVRSGGKVLFGDEGVAPWLRRKLFGRILINANGLYRHRPPIDMLPAVARDVRLHWVLGNAFYVIEYRVGDDPPFVDLDLPIPGPRNGTLRSRFYGP